MKIAVTVTYSIQISNDDFISTKTTRSFSADRPIKDIFIWANIYLPAKNHNDLSFLTFSNYKDDSI